MLCKTLHNIHCLLTEGGFSDDGFWRIVTYFDYTYLRKAFQTALLGEMEKRIGPSFKKQSHSSIPKIRMTFMSMLSPTCATPIPL